MQEEKVWDYGPDNGVSCSGTVEAWTEASLPYVTGNSTRLGRSYLKVAPPLKVESTVFDPFGNECVYRESVDVRG